MRRELDAERFTNASDSGTSLEYQRHHHQQQYPANDNTAAASIRKGIDDILFRSNSNGTTTANGASSSSAYQQTNGGVAHTDPFYPTAAHQNLARSGLSISSEQDAHRGISTIPEDGSSRGKSEVVVCD